MSPPYYPMMHVGNASYWPPPYSLDPLPKELHHGLIPLGLLATLSVGATLSLICFICYRLVTWKMHYNSFLGYNQYVLLVLNLLIADLQQSAAFLFSWHWIRFDRMLAPSSPCFAQAWLLHSGDVSSGLFVLAIAIHTFWTALRGTRVGHKTFAACVFCIWVFTYFVTGFGVALHGNKYFVHAGAWCWVSEAYETDRLFLHYIWVFLVQFGTVFIYVATFLMLRRKTRKLFREMQQGHNANTGTILAVNRVAKLMTLYPFVYVLLTLPLSAGRMWSYAHHGEPFSYTFGCVAGCMITCCGWADSLLYTLTRRRLLQETMPSGASRRTNDTSHLGIMHTRTITVEGGHTMDSFDDKGDAHNRLVGTDQSLSRTGSVEPILSSRPTPKKSGLGFRATVEDDRLAEEREKDDRLGHLPSEMPMLLSNGWSPHEA